jgi:TonB family protein
MPTPAEKAAWNEVIESKYPHEPLPSWPVPKIKIVPDNNLQTALPEMMAYARMVQTKISKAILYPQTIGGIALAGTVKLKLRILKDGSLNSEEVVESSGNNILDQDAMQAAKTAAPYDAFTTGMEQEDLVFTVPIVYNKLISGGKSPAEKVIAAY